MEDVVITHGGNDRRYQTCRCARCKVEQLCTPDNDFYTAANDDNGLLYCEDCMLKQYADKRAAN